jgi:lipopolysaccharide export system protein LptA
MVLGLNNSFAQEIDFGRPDANHVVSVEADQIQHWTQGEYQVLYLLGSVKLHQESLRAVSNEAVLFVENFNDEEGKPVKKVIAYLEGGVVIDKSRYGPVEEFTRANSDRIVDDIWLGRLFTDSKVTLSQAPVSAEPQSPLIYQRAIAAIEKGGQGNIRQVAFQQGQVINPMTGEIQNVGPGNAPNVPDLSVEGQLEPVPTAPSVVVPNPSRQPPAQNSNPRAAGGRQGRNSNVNFYSRDSKVDLNVRIVPNPNAEGEWIIVAPGGVRVVIDDPGIPLAQLPGQQPNNRERQIVILADNVISWESRLPNGETRSEVYLEGNVVFAQGSRVIYAEQMYYDTSVQQGTIFNADMLTPAGNFEGLVRLKADVIQQVDQNNLQAYGAAFTSSRMGFPRYWLQSDGLAINRQDVASFDSLNGQPVYDPQTGLPKTDDEYFVESQGNSVYLGGVPVLQWPRFRSSLTEPRFYLSKFKIGNDQIFGTQLQTGWDLYQVLGWRNAPRGTKWIGNLDYLSERGLGFGTDFDYQFRNGFLGIPGQVDGFYKSWFINDSGLDTLGRGRVNLTPEEEFRGRIKARHRHRFSPGFQLRAELGYVSDRNFLEQYYEREWDNDKDYTTGLWLERNIGTQSYNLIADLQINDFFTQTSWLPRYEHFVLGQPLGNRFVWNARNHAGYGRFRVADAPTDPVDLAPFDTLAWEANDVDGFRVGTRHEISAPAQIGNFKVVPYVLGDVTYWQEDINGDDLLRGFVQTGIRASTSIWKVDPTIQSTLWNVNGLAHKVTFDTDIYFADASQDFDELPLYDPLDDDAQEAFRHRLAFNTFGIPIGGDVDLKYDERTFALRSGLQRYVTSPSTELVEDQTAIRMGVRQRWQTKRGLPGSERIIDWITLDTQTILFPDADRDNFGAPWGMSQYDFAWHIGDRLSVVSDGHLDFFGQGLRTISVGGVITRPDVGNLYLGYRMIEGPISSNIITARMSYRMSDKWGVTGSTAFDLGEAGRLGQALNFIYIGESFLWRFGVNADFSRDNVGFQFGFEPRFARGRLFRPGGSDIGPASSRWLE